MCKILLCSRYYDVKIYVNCIKENRNGDGKENCDEIRQSQRFRHNYIVIAILEMKMIFIRTLITSLNVEINHYREQQTMQFCYLVDKLCLSIYRVNRHPLQLFTKNKTPIKFHGFTQ